VSASVTLERLENRKDHHVPHLSKTLRIDPEITYGIPGFHRRLVKIDRNQIWHLKRRFADRGKIGWATFYSTLFSTKSVSPCGIAIVRETCLSQHLIETSSQSYAPRMSASQSTTSTSLTAH